ncbi:Exosome complex component RRP43 [Lobulomyces angularis]|nr:Exosome complex component RRP43 [Lobulomyces angularis]
MNNISDTENPSQFQLDSTTFLKIHPLEYNKRFFNENTRADGRNFTEARNTKVMLNCFKKTSNGSSQVKIGNTLISCGVKAQINQPSVTNPNEGFLVINVDLPSFCSAKFKPGPPGNQTQYLSEYLNKIIKSSGLLDLNQLLIKKEKFCWVLYVDIICLNYDGNFFDGAILALTTALKTTRLPKIVYNENNASIKIVNNEFYFLNLSNFPVTVTFGIFDSEVILMDPTDDEEKVLSGQIMITIDAGGNILSLLKFGGNLNNIAINKTILENCFEQSLVRQKVLRLVVDECLNEFDFDNFNMKE